MTREELLKEAIRRFRVIADDARQITLGNISHSTPKQIERYAVNSYELLETHICDEENNNERKITMETITNEEKANEIARDMLPYNNAEYHACYNSAMKAMQWKEQQLIYQLTAFAQHLNKRGAFRDDLCMDFEHEAQSFIEMQNNKEL